MEELARRWGIGAGPSRWGTRLRILFVIDGRVSLKSEPYDFGLGLVLDTLRDESVAWWVRIRVDVVRRDGSPEPLENPSRGPYEEQYVGFRFTQEGFDINDYDQVWFFGDNPGKQADEPDTGDEIIHQKHLAPLASDELRVIAEWMDRGGGVFAAGDHSLLGASMCSRIPRVRTMRRWTHARGVPTFGGATRNQTLQGTSPIPEPLEGDAVGQPIEPVFRLVGSPHSFLRRVPHPLLCAGDRVIETFPDHMHEGEVIEDGDVDLDRPLDIPGYSGLEYPPETEIVQPTAASDVLGPEFRRPRPHVIAHGRTTHEVVEPRRFALVSTYDGDRAQVGRVVVDSTWHHWFSMNTIGFKNDNPDVYARIQAYHRNVALWLAPPSKRVSMLVAASWGVLTGGGPMAFQGPLSPWEIGDRIIAGTANTLSSCMLTDIVATTLRANASELTTVRPELAAEPLSSRLSEELMNRAIIGGLGAALCDLALEHRDASARDQRPRLDPNGIRQRAVKGISDGHQLLMDTLSRAASDAERLRSQLAIGLRPLPLESIAVSVEILSIRVVLEGLQFPDPSDPALARGPVTLTARARLNGSVVAACSVTKLDLPAFHLGRYAVDLGSPALEAVAQSGERLTVEVLVGVWGQQGAPPESVRFEAIHDGDPASWLGSHTPARAQPWRLWYRIELTADGP